MYTREHIDIPFRYGNRRPTRNTHTNTPSFSSTLLDQIYRSIDGNGRQSDKLKEPDQMPRVSRTLETAEARWMSEFEKSALIFRRSTNSSSSDSSFFGSRCRARSKVPNCFMFDDRQTNRKSKTGDDSIIKSKSTTTHRVCTGLKKVKQPISPGGRLASFISSIFEKKSKKLEELHFRDSSSKSVRSGLAEGMKPTVRFHPASVIAVADLGNRGHTSERGEFGKPPLPPNNIGVGVRIGGQNGKFEEKSKKAFAMCGKVEEEEDYFSDSSSDLFELDHKALFGDYQIPVYETAYLF